MICHKIWNYDENIITHKNARGWAGASVERSTRERGEILWGAGFAVTVR